MAPVHSESHRHARWAREINKTTKHNKKQHNKKQQGGIRNTFLIERTGGESKDSNMKRLSIKFVISHQALVFLTALVIQRSLAQNTMVKMCLFYENSSGHARSDPIINQNCASGHVHTVSFCLCFIFIHTGLLIFIS